MPPSRIPERCLPAGGTTSSSGLPSQSALLSTVQVRDGSPLAPDGSSSEFAGACAAVADTVSCGTGVTGRLCRHPGRAPAGGASGVAGAIGREPVAAFLELTLVEEPGGVVSAAFAAKATALLFKSRRTTAKAAPALSPAAAAADVETSRDKRVTQTALPLMPRPARPRTVGLNRSSTLRGCRKGVQRSPGNGAPALGCQA